jgi:hypothetical protein
MRKQDAPQGAAQRDPAAAPRADHEPPVACHGSVDFGITILVLNTVTSDGNNESRNRRSIVR